MTEGETRFYLREIHAHWSPSTVSPEKLAELHAANLIEISDAPIRTVRLTHEGTRRKVGARDTSPNPPGGISLTGRTAPPRRARSQRQYSKNPRKKGIQSARPLV